LDDEELLPGQEWQVEIAKAVRTSDVVLVCLSPRSVAKDGYVQKEIKLALDVADEKPEGTIFVVPLKLEECEVPTRLAKWHWTSLNQERGYVQLLRSLRHCANKLGLKPEARAIAPQPVASKPENPDLRSFAVEKKCPKCGSRQVEGRLHKWEINDVSVGWWCDSCHFSLLQDESDPYHEVLENFYDCDWRDGGWQRAPKRGF